MSTSAARFGAVLAAVNVLAFVAMLAARPPEYDGLRRRDAAIRSGGPIEMTTADPHYMAARPFYSSAHTQIPFPEFLYFLVNTPAEFGSFILAFELYPLVMDVFAPDVITSTAQDSWVMAIAFGVCAAVEAFVVGLLIGQWRSRRQQVDDQ